MAPLHPHPFAFSFRPIDAATGAVDGPPFQARSVPGGDTQDFLVSADGAVPGFLDSVPLRFACQDGQATVEAVKGCTVAPVFGPLRRLSQALCARLGSPS